MKQWQNLIEKKCPNCASKLNTHWKGFICPSDPCGFFITRETITSILMDDSHGAIRFASKEQKETRDRVLRELGIE